MKQNGNNKTISDYYIGLDVGTNSVGWSVSDKEYNVLRFKGNSMWGVRMFDEALDASGRRGFRSGRRRLERRKQRLYILELLFSEAISKVDPLFFTRLHESSLYADDKSKNVGSYALFNDEKYTDEDYLKAFPTIYHLRSELLQSKKAYDVRLVFLALHHIMKHRGHFLFDSDNGDNEKTISAAIDDLNVYLDSEFSVTISFSNRESFEEALCRSDIGITAKKRLLKEFLSGESQPDDMHINISLLSDMLSGASVKLSDLFFDESLKTAEIRSLSLKNDIEENFDILSEELGDRVQLILELKTVFDTARLSQILGTNSYISDAKIELYNKNHDDLRLLKKFVREKAPDSYKLIFNERKNNLNNYAAYSRYKTSSIIYTCSQDDFCTFLNKTLKQSFEESVDIEEYNRIHDEIANKTFLTRLTGSDNGIIPNQLHRKELVQILKNASSYLGFLNTVDTDGLTVSDKIISIFDFRIPYYVGPLNKNSPKAWVVRTDEKIYPWNFNKIVDTEKSAEQFIINLIGKCSYTGLEVIPKNSLLYSEYMVLNEINLIRVNGKELPIKVKQDLYNDLFVLSNRKVTKKSIKAYLLSKGLIRQNEEIIGVDIEIKSKLKSYHDFKNILDKTKDTDMVEDIIRHILIFGDDKKMLQKWIKNHCKGLDEKDILNICYLKYKDWGRFSKEFLTEVYHPDENGEAKSIIELLRSTNKNLMQLLSNDFQFAANAENIRKSITGSGQGLRDMVDDMYVAPSVKRSIWQTLRIVDEIVDIRKSAPEKIFIEVARGSSEDMKDNRTVSRKDKLIELYKKCGEESSELFLKLKDEQENKLRRDKLYLYYTQFGKCMYTKEAIDFSALTEGNESYDIDHIFPRSRVKDDSIDNRVLVRSALNRNKTNIYPISEDIRKNMYSYWKMLSDKGLISEKKFSRLVRSTPLTDKELSDFVARQLVETQQSTKALASIMKAIYPETNFVYSKAGNVSDFRHQFGFIKCREINDLHHAKDAYLNIVVGNVYDTKFTKNFFLNIRNEKYSLSRVFEFNTPGAWQKDVTIANVRSNMSKNNILTTRMPKEVKGQLYDLKIMPAGKGQLSIKEGKQIQRYGGYNKIAGAYFFVVEHTEKENRIRTIEPVFIYKKSLYESNPIAYCTELLNLVDPVIVAPIIRFNSLLQINGALLNITGRQGKQIVYKHAYQLAIDKKHEQYIKNIAKYVDRCISAKVELKVTDYDSITSELNIDFYDWYISKFKAPVYMALFKNILEDLLANREKFVAMSLLTQCKLLLEILKAFICDRQNPNLNDLCGKKTVGTILKPKKISNCDSVVYINQSITGLFETRVDLLK